jgi:putative transposase
VTDDAISAEVIKWQNWPLCCRYVVVLIDTLRVEIRDEGVVRDKAIHLALGMHAESAPEVLGLWLEQSAGAPFWPEVCSQLENRGVERIRIVMADGPNWSTGLPEALQAAFPATTLQTSPAPLIRHSLNNATRRDRKPLAAALRSIQAAASAERAQAALDALVAGPWGAKYPSMVQRWQAAWQPRLLLFALPRDVRRRAVAAVHIIENLQLRVGRMIGRHGCFASDVATTEFAWRAQRDVMQRWSRTAQAERVTKPLRPGV